MLFRKLNKLAYLFGLAFLLAGMVASVIETPVHAVAKEKIDWCHCEPNGNCQTLHLPPEALGNAGHMDANGNPLHAGDYAGECVDPTAEPTIEQPTLVPTIENTVEPTAEYTAEYTPEEPTLEPTIENTLEPTPEDTPEEPTLEPTLENTEEPTLEPTIKNTLEPTVEYTAVFTPEIPTQIPTEVGTQLPTQIIETLAPPAVVVPTQETINVIQEAPPAEGEPLIPITGGRTPTRTPQIVIPVTGADNTSFNPIRVGFLNLGMLFFGIGLVMSGTSKFKFS